jgi:lipopolysaccharide O-acetyltransferase
LDAFPESKSNTTCIAIGSNVQINDYVHIAAISNITIGNNVLIASKVFITDHNHGEYGMNNYHDSPDMMPILRPLRSRPVIIEDNVWIGETVSILPGVKIGQGSVIGAQSVVTKDIPPNSVAIGAPARVIKQYDFESGKWQKTKS